MYGILGTKKSILIVFVIFGLLAAGGWFVLPDKAEIFRPEPESNPPLFSLAIAGVPLKVELADTPDKRAQGLSGRADLPENQGLLFVFERPGHYFFWMKEMRFPLDIIWINETGRIVEISQNVPVPAADAGLVSYGPPEPVQYVLEVNAGFAERNNIQIGERVDFGSLSLGLSFQELVFVEDAQNNQVIVLDLKGEIVKRIPVGREPHDIAASPDGQWVATGNFGDGTVSIIDTKTLEMIKTINTGTGAHGVVFSPDGQFLFAVNAREDTLSIIETESFEEQKKIKIGDFPEYVGVTQDGSKIFTTNLGNGGSITLLQNNGFESAVIKQIVLGIDPHGWAVSPDGAKIVITNLGSDFTYILDSQTFQEISHIDTGAATEFAAFRDNNELWVTNIGAQYVSIINLKQNEVVDKIIVGETPHGISFSQDPEGEASPPYGAGKTLAFVPLYKSGQVVIIDTAKKEIIRKVKAGEKLHNLVMVKSSYAE
jgi:YVTN family beta-propeller protein